MRFPTIKKLINPGTGLIVLLIILYLGVWVLNYAFLPDYRQYVAASIRLVDPKPFELVGVILLITAVNIVLITQINSRFSIIRTKTFIPAFLYALLIATWKESHFLIMSHLVGTVFLISLLIFLSMYRDKTSVQQSFTGTLLLSITGLFFPPYMFLILLSWLGFFILKCNSPKVFIASIMGALIPWIYYFAYSYLSGSEITVFQSFTIDFQPGLLLIGRPVHEHVYLTFTLLIMIISVIGTYKNLYNDSLQTRKNINLIVVFLLFLVLTIFIFPKQALAFLPLIAIGYAFIFAHPLSLKTTKFYSILFFLFLLVNIVYMGYNFLLQFNS